MDVVNDRSGKDRRDHSRFTEMAMERREYLSNCDLATHRFNYAEIVES